NTYGPPQLPGSGSFYVSQTYGGSSPRFIPEPDCRSRIYDTAAPIKREFEGRVSQVRGRAQSIRRRLQELVNLFGTQSNSRFVFVHVPFSDGKIYTQKQEIVDVQVVPWNTQLPAGYVDENTATQLFGFSDLDKTRRAGQRFLQERAKLEADQLRTQQRRRSQDQSSRESFVDRGLASNQDGRNQPAQAYQPPPPPPPPKMIFLLRGYDRKQAVRENQEARDYAELILEMFTGALDQQRRAMSKSFPLPRIGSSVRFPVGPDARNQAKAMLRQLAQPQTLQAWVADPTSGDPRGRLAQQILPPQVDPALADCYIDALDKVTADERVEKARGQTRW
ncbi:MAG: hypothetical protein AAB250_18020, partial [Bdellovibrionota bacterium]